MQSNVLARTKETLESYLVKRIAQLNSDRRAKSTSKQSALDRSLGSVMQFENSMYASGGDYGGGSPRKPYEANNSMISNRNQRPRYNSQNRGIPSRRHKRNEDLRLLSLMQRNKNLSKNFYQPIEWTN